jgi:hypothetical protein
MFCGYPAAALLARLLPVLARGPIVRGDQCLETKGCPGRTALGRQALTVSERRLVERTYPRRREHLIGQGRSARLREDGP